MSSSTYFVSAKLGSLVDVDAQSGRCTRAPRAARASQRGREAALGQVIGQHAVRDRHLAPQCCSGRRGECVEARVDRRVDPADEERGHARDVRKIAGACFEPRQVRLDHLVVTVEGEQQGDVDRDALACCGSNRFESGSGAGDLDVEVRGGQVVVQRSGRGEGARAVVSQGGGDLDRHVTVFAAARVMNRSQDRQRVADVGLDQLPIGHFDVSADRDEFAELRVIRGAVADGVLEDRRVRGQPSNAPLDPGRQLARLDPVAPQVIEPRALLLLIEEVVKAGHGILRGGPTRGRPDC